MMLAKLKENKLIVGIALIVHSIMMLAVCLAVYNGKEREKRGIAGVLLAIAAAGGIIGAYMLCLEEKESAAAEKQADGYSDFLKNIWESDFDLEDEAIEEPEIETVEEPIIIPVDETVDENEFNEN